MWRLALLIVSALHLAGEAVAQSVAVVVHPSRRLELGVDEIARIYLKQQRFWDSGDAILPINLEARSALRRSFERVVFGGRARGLGAYWHREYFRGVLPPATLASHEAMRRFVANEPRAIGYLPAEVVDETVHVAARLATEGPARSESFGGERRVTQNERRGAPFSAQPGLRAQLGIRAPRPGLRAVTWERAQRCQPRDRDAEKLLPTAAYSIRARRSPLSKSISSTGPTSPPSPSRPPGGSGLVSGGASHSLQRTCQAVREGERGGGTPPASIPWLSRLASTARGCRFRQGTA